jgi:predicted RNase H-like nuclease (RuvC/YqgF family)
MNHAIRKEHHKRQQEQHRDRLIDSASPEPRSGTVREKKYQMVMKKLKQRRKRLTRGLAVVKEGMEKMKTEIENVLRDMDIGDS